MSAFPPLRTQKGIPVSPETALGFLSAYLTSAKTSPYLLPNARLEASGPTAGSSNSSVTIHNLQRVEAGLRGEWLAPKLDLEEGNVEISKGMDDGTVKEGGEREEEGWMDLDQYQREQSVEGPEQAQEEIGVEDGDEIEGGPIVVDDDGVEEQPETPKVNKSKKNLGVDMEGTRVTKVPVDAAARKREKKERHKAEKKAKEELRKKQSHNAA